MSYADRLADLAKICAAAVAEARRTDPEALLDCAGWPTGLALLTHLGGHFGWVTAAIGATERPSRPHPPETTPLVDWFVGECNRFVDVLTSTPGSTSAWTFDGTNTVGFWHRRSLYEVGRHVWDLRTAGHVRPGPPAEFSPARYADGVSEHFDVFLTRSRDTLAPLPGALRLNATDTDASWYLASDWGRAPDGPVEATVSATAGELALLVWERADALVQPQFRVEGDERIVAAFQSAPIHA